MSRYLLLEDGGRIQFDHAPGYYVLNGLVIGRLDYPPAEDRRHAIDVEDRIDEVDDDNRREDVMGGQ